MNLSDKELSALLEVEIAGIKFKNPVMGASGTFGYGLEFAELIDLNKLGGFSTKGLSARPLPGNVPTRIVETHGGMLNAIGLQNVGARAFVKEKLPLLREFDTQVIANVFGYSDEDYIETINMLNDGEGIAAYELNISCPNVAIFLRFELYEIVYEMLQLTLKSCPSIIFFLQIK